MKKKILPLFILLAISCNSGPVLKEYTYIYSEYSYTAKDEKTSSSVIKAPDDSTAYAEAYKMYCVAEAKFGASTDPVNYVPKSFKVLDKENNEIQPIDEETLNSIKLRVFYLKDGQSPEGETHKSGMNPIGIAFLVILFCFILGIIIRAMKEVQKEREKRQIEEQAEIQRIRDEAEKAYLERKRQKEETIQKYHADIESLSDLYGVPDKTISLGVLDVNKEIRAYSEKKIIYIFGKTFDFSSIIDCHLTDNARVEKGETTITSKGDSETDTGSMLGRAIVGGVLAGGVGAIIGGSTAKTSTSTTSVVKQGEDRTHHDYTVWISVKDIANPVISIPVGANLAQANEIVSLMKAIITIGQEG